MGLFQCAHKLCNVERRVLHQFVGSELSKSIDGIECPSNGKSDYTKSIHTRKLKYTVYEVGTHYKDHTPVTRSHYPWIQNQKKHLEYIFNINPMISATNIHAELSKISLLRGVTVKIIRGWLKRRRKTTSLPLQTIYLDIIQDLIEYLRNESSTIHVIRNNIVSNWPTAFILPNSSHPYMLLGKAVPEKKPLKTNDGRAYSWCIPMSSPRLLYHHVKARQVEVRGLSFYYQEWRIF